MNWLSNRSVLYSIEQVSCRPAQTKRDRSSVDVPGSTSKGSISSPNTLLGKSAE